MIKKIILTVLLYIVTLYLLIISNVTYMFFGTLSKNNIGILLVFVVGVFILFLYMLYLMIRGIHRKEINKEYGYSYLGFFVVLFIFYFGYYIQYDKGEEIPETLFETALQNIEIKDEENGLVLLGEFLKYNWDNKSNIYYLDKNINNTYTCLIPDRKGNKKECKKDSLKNTLEKYQENSDYINELNIKLSKITDKEYFKEEIRGEYTSLQGLSTLSRISLFSAINHLEKGENKKALITLLTYKELGKKLLEGDSTIIGMIVGITTNSIASNNINYIIENYKLEKEELELLSKAFDKDYNVDKIFENAMKIEYQSNIYSFKRGASEGFFKNSILFNKEEYFNEKRKATLDILNGNDNYFDKYKSSYFKRVYMYRFIGTMSVNVGFNNYRKDLDILNIKNKELLDKINKKLG